jgi:hypothetical protein
LKRLVSKKLPWKTQQWISSGFDEPTAQRVRSRVFRSVLRERSAGGLGWLRRLHRSHSPQSGPFSTCMHRTDAATVSYTEISVSDHRAKMGYHGGPPCKSAFWNTIQENECKGRASGIIGQDSLQDARTASRITSITLRGAVNIGE